MIIEHKEDISSSFAGTIIDIETIGEFLNQYPDSRCYKDVRLVIFGFINKSAFHILCSEGIGALNELKERTRMMINSMERPFYAFNANCERSVLFYELGKEIEFNGELQAYRFESKREAVRSLGIPNYDDPFDDKGILCMTAWKKGEFDKAIAHNRACLLKEKDILVKRRFRKPDELNFVK